MKNINPIYEDAELRVFNLDDEYVTYYNNYCYCGEPGFVGQEPKEKVKISQLLNAGASDSYIVEVKGDSMRDADIKDGDRVIINTQRSVKDGDIVLAMIHGEVLLKYLQHDKYGGAWLVPANNSYKPMKVEWDENNRILGVLVSIIRQLPTFNAVLRGRLDVAIDEEYRFLQTSQEEAKPIYKIMLDEIDKKKVLQRMHTVLDGKSGVEVIKILQAARACKFLLRMPSLNVLTEEFDVDITKSYYYRIKDKIFNQSELDDYIEALQ